MSDYLLVSGVGMGGWAWDQTWGYLTAPVESPPRLYQRRLVGKVVSINLAGSTGRDINPKITPEESVAAMGSVIKANSLQDLVLVGHEVAAPFVLKAAAAMDTPARGIVLVSGVIPTEGGSPLSAFPFPLRLAFSMMTALNGYGNKGFKLPKPVITNVLCSGLEPTEIIKALGLFRPVPVEMLKSKVSLRDVDLPCPVTYVVLTQDRLLSVHRQREMARRLGDVRLVHLEACHAAMLHRPKALAEILLRFA